MDQAKAMLASWLRSYLAAALAVYMAGGDIKQMAMGGVAAVVPVILRWLNPKLLAAGLTLILSTSLAACGYQGWVRYPCQLHENWDKPECKKPKCQVTGTCTEDLIGDGFKR
jgi:hypothetical protein